MEIADKIKLPAQHYSLVFKEGKWRMVNNAGVEVFAFQKKYRELALIGNGLIKAKNPSPDNGPLRYGVINLNEEVMIDYNYESIELYNGYMVCSNLDSWEDIEVDCIQYEEGEYIQHERLYHWRSTVYSSLGKKLREPYHSHGYEGLGSTNPDVGSYEGQDIFSCNSDFIIPEEINGKIRFIASDGNPVCPPIYDSYRFVSIGAGLGYGHHIGAAIVNIEELSGVIDKYGVEIVPVMFDSVSLLDEYKIEAVLKGEKYVYDVLEVYKERRNVELNRLQNTSVLTLSSHKNKWGYINEQGETVLAHIYDEASQFYGEHALVLWRGEWCMIDKTGKIKDFKETEGVPNMVVRVHDWSSDKWGYINGYGQKVVDCIYDKATEFYGEHALVLWSGTLPNGGDVWFMIDKAGKEVALFCNKYSHMSFLSKDLIRVNSIATEPEDVKKGVINFQEKVIVECKYEYIGSYCGYIICNNIISREVGLGAEEEYMYLDCEVESTIYTATGEKLKGPDRIKTSVEWYSEHESLSTVCDSEFIRGLRTTKVPEVIGNVIVYKPTDRLMHHKRAGHYGELMSDIYKYHVKDIEHAIRDYPEFAIDIEAFEKLPAPTPVYMEDEFHALLRDKKQEILASAEAEVIYLRNQQKEYHKAKENLIGLRKEDETKLLMRTFSESWGIENITEFEFLNRFIKEQGYRPKPVNFKFSDEIRKLNEAKIKRATGKV